MNHDALKEKAIEAIRALHGDSSVSLQTTWESLCEIDEEVQSLMESVQVDFRNQES